MKNIDTEKLLAYLDAKFSEFGEEYERQFEISMSEKDDEIPAIIGRIMAANEKRNFLNKLENDILGGRFDA